MISKNKQVNSYSLLAGVIAALIAVGLYQAYFRDHIEPYWASTLFKLRGVQSAPGNVTIVGIDEDAYKKIDANPRYPFPRSGLANAVNHLKALGAKGVVVDLMFAGSDLEAGADEKLIEAFSKIPTVIATFLFGTPEKSDFPVTVIQEPESEFKKAAKNLGNVWLEYDNGVVRRFPQRTIYSEGKYVRSLGEEGARFFGEVSKFPKEWDLINFYGPRNTLKMVPIYELLKEGNDDALRPLFKGKVVYIGGMERIQPVSNRKDTFLTPFDSRPTFGVEIQATIAENLISSKWIHRASSLVEAYGNFLITFLAVIFLFFTTPTTGFIGFFTLSLGWFGLSYYLFLQGFFLPGISTLLVLFFVLLFCTVRSFSIAEGRLQTVRVALRRYLSPELAALVENDPLKLTPGTEEKEIAFSVTDLASFTSLSESDKDKALQVLNSYLPLLSDKVKANSGMVISFTGDGGYAIWGGVVPLSNACDLALKTVLEIRSSLNNLVATAKIPPIRARYSLHYGLADVGNKGSESYIQFDATGDNTNLTFRLADAAKDFGVELILTEVFLSKLSETPDMFYLGTVLVQGKRKPVNVYTIFEKPVSKNTRAGWDEARSLFIKKEWRAARDKFIELSRVEPRLQKAAALYVGKCAYRENKCRGVAPDYWKGELRLWKGH